MENAFEYLRQFNFASVVFRLLLAMLAGGVIGIGRSQKGTNAGMRTFMLTSIGAALTIIISMYEYEMLTGQWASIVETVGMKFDASRLSAHVVNGIGFLAAGTIIAVAHKQVSGLTTAIGLFTSACMGIAAGAGFYECVIIAVVIIIFTMEFMKPLEVGFKRRLHNMTVFVEFNSIEDIQTITDTIEAEGAKIYDMDLERTQRDAEGYPSAIFTLKLSRENGSHSAILSSVAELRCV